MSTRINTILIIGAGGGIGEASAIYRLGKKVIVTGRKQKRDLAGIDYWLWDLTQIDELQDQVRNILEGFPKLDSVFINAGIQNHYDIFQRPASQAEVIKELTTNLMAPILVAQAFAPYLFALANSGTKTNLFLTSSSLATTKAGIAAFTKAVRLQLEATGSTNMNVVEVVPPYVDTPLNASHRDQIDALQGGKQNAVQPMPLQEYIDRFFHALEQVKPDGSFRNEIGVGFGAIGAEIWNERYLKLWPASGMAE